MEKTWSRLGRVLKDLALACLNATLLLLLISMLLYFMAARKMESVTDSFARSVAVVTPLREDVAEMRQGLLALRDAMTAPGRSVTPEVQAQLDALAARTQMLQAALEEVSGAPARLLDQAIRTGAQEARATLMVLRACPRPDDATPLRP